jgi:hypothetical protein
MADFDSSLPIRTENDGDVVVKVGDGTLPSQQLGVDASGRVTTKINDGAGNSISSTGGSLDVNVTTVDIDIRDLSASQDNVAISDGTDTLAVNADGSINSVVTATDLDIRDLTFAQDKVDASGSVVALDAPTLAALESITVQNGAGASAVNIQDGGNSITVDGTVELGATTLAALESITVQNGAGASAVNIQDGGNSITVDATDLDIRDLTAASDSVKAQLADGSGTYYSATNPIPVAISTNNIGSEINDYNTTAAVVAGASSNHDYTVTAAKTLLLSSIEASASGKMKIEVQIETAAASGVFNTKFVQFNSTANTNMSIKIPDPISVVAGAKVRIIRTNRDNQSQDVYSTISGQEVP